MKRTRMLLSILVPMLLSTTAPAFAVCEVEGKGEANFNSNAFPSLQHTADAMMECNKLPGVKVTTKLSTEHQEESLQALQSGNSPFEIVQVSNGSFVPLYTKGLIQPMTDLVEKYRTKYKIEDSMLIRYNGEVYAIAFQTNLPYLWYRKDLLEKHGIAVPKTYDELLAAADVLKKSGDMEFPLGGPFKAGWNMATEFTNIYRSMGGEFFEKGSAMPVFDNANAVKSMELIKKMMPYMSPNILGLATGDITTSFQQGTLAMSNMWASRASALDDPATSRVVGKMAFAPSPTTVSGGKPASNLWWDGWVMAKKSDGDRDLAFQVLMEGLDEETVARGNDLANWLRSNFKPTPYAQMVRTMTTMGTPVWPDQPYFDLAHAALGKAIPDYLTGKKTAETALADAKAEYMQAAKSAGFIN